MLLDVADGTLDVVATNRYWMAVRSLPVAPGAAGRLVLGLPEAERLCAHLDRRDEAVVDLTPDGLVVDGRTFPLRDVAFPAHRMLLEGLPPTLTRLVLPRADLVAAIDEARAAEVDLVVTSDGVRVGAREVLGAVDCGVASLRLGSALARRALESMLGRDVVLRLGSETRPVLVTSPYQPGLLALLMPIARASSDER